MSRTPAFLCLFALLLAACPDDETPATPTAGQPADAGSAEPNQVEAEAGSKASAPAQPTAGSSGSGGSSGNKATGSAGSGGRAGQPAKPDKDKDDDAGTDKPTGGACSVGGCSNQLCTDAAAGGVVSTCEWREEYACYSDATCERQADGRCGWTTTPALTSCLENARN